MKQSSIEWFATRLLSELGLTIEDTKTHNPTLYDLIQQSKEMHKQEVVDAYWDGGQDIPLTGERCEDYFNKVYKN